MALSGVIEAIRPTKGGMILLALCAFFALASFSWGYNIGVMASIYVHPGFKKALHNPSSSHTGLITSIYYLGTFLSYLFVSHPAADYLGRKGAAACGVLITCVGAAIQCGAKGSGAYAMMIVGRIICGFGIAITSTSVPLYQSEVSPAKHRGRYVVLNHVGFVAGLAIAFWVGYGMTHWTTSQGDYLGWRLSLAVQFIPAVIFLVGLPFCPETPRWLVGKGHIGRARKNLAYLRGANAESEIVNIELAEIQRDIDDRQLATQQSWTVLFTDRALFNRFWRAALLQFMAQMCGNTSMKYYLPTIFKTLGLGRQLSLMISGIESTLKIGCTIIEMLIVDKVGRRATLVFACVLMAFALLINGVLPQVYPFNVNQASDYTCILFIFVYTLGYSIGFGPAAWVYGSEIFPTKFRARGLNIAASAGSIGSVISSQVWPVGIQNIGSRTHFIFMSTNIASAVIIWFFYPETKRRSLEDMDALFDPKYRSHMDVESAHAREEEDEDDLHVARPKDVRA